MSLITWFSKLEADHHGWSLAAAVWVHIAAGNGYTFPLYSSAPKSVLSVNKEQEWLALCFATNSKACFGTAVLVTNMRNFPPSRGTVVGILSGYVGISATVYTVVYSMVFKVSASGLLLFLAVGISVVCIAMMNFVRACTPFFRRRFFSACPFLFNRLPVFFFPSYLVITTAINNMISVVLQINWSEMIVPPTWILC
ncbi:protein NUCLEAR FUSION DEFECTIVE 4 [Quillaja saponaria]|uniref:Protein NUCLEAR FUSION DEFECTIVE 4 n=1 Tax=Quillaja saponaria TaxID=32244 RepID=A0AAD7PPX7_QUISA|nr:protein NUCLEAR FUSION DEFECTIVE 4 [Quillaja saponaria]